MEIILYTSLVIILLVLLVFSRILYLGRGCRMLVQTVSMPGPCSVLVKGQVLWSEVVPDIIQSVVDGFRLVGRTVRLLGRGF